MLCDCNPILPKEYIEYNKIGTYDQMWDFTARETFKTDKFTKQSEQYHVLCIKYDPFFDFFAGTIHVPPSLVRKNIIHAWTYSSHKNKSDCVSLNVLFESHCSNVESLMTDSLNKAWRMYNQPINSCAYSFIYDGYCYDIDNYPNDYYINAEIIKHILDSYKVSDLEDD